MFIMEECWEKAGPLQKLLYIPPIQEGHRLRLHSGAGWAKWNTVRGFLMPNAVVSWILEGIQTALESEGRNPGGYVYRRFLLS